MRLLLATTKQLSCKRKEAVFPVVYLTVDRADGPCFETKSNQSILESLCSKFLSFEAHLVLVCDVLLNIAISIKWLDSWIVLPGLLCIMLHIWKTFGMTSVETSSLKTSASRVRLCSFLKLALDNHLQLSWSLFTSHNSQLSSCFLYAPVPLPCSTLPCRQRQRFKECYLFTFCSQVGL